MFKVVREYIDQPIFLLMCDNRNCGAMARGLVNLSNKEEYALSHSTFLRAAAKDGWTIGLEGQMCPGHSALMQQQAEAAEERGKMEVREEKKEEPVRLVVPTLRDVKQVKESVIRSAD